MRKLLEKYRDWDKRRQLKLLERWHGERTKGKGRYVLRNALAWAGMMLTVSILWDDFYGKFDLILTMFRIPVYLGGGVIFGLWLWSSSESKYQHLLKSSRMGSSPTIRLN